MTEHFSIEDMEKYLEEDFSEEYLVWLEKAEAHLCECESCQEKLRRFMLVDAVANEFYTAALPGMQQIEEAAKEEAERRSVAERLAAFFAGTELAQKAERFAESLKTGITQKLLELQESLTLPPYVARGGNTSEVHVYFMDFEQPMACADVHMGELYGGAHKEDERDKVNWKLRNSVLESARKAGARVEYCGGKLHVSVSFKEQVEEGKEPEVLLCYKTEQGEQFAILQAQKGYYDAWAEFDVPEKISDVIIYVNYKE